MEIKMNEDIEEEIIVETEDDEQASPEKPSDEKVLVSGGEEEELTDYSKNVQKRIKKLTERNKNAERDREEAVRVAQQLLNENNELKSRVQKVDTGYLNEYGNRLGHQEQAAKNAYKNSYEAGDSDGLLAAQEQLTQIAVDKQKYTEAQHRVEQQQKVAVERQQVAQQQQPVAQQQQPARKTDPKAEAWAQKNAWFGEDEIMTQAAFTFHRRLVEEEGFDPESEDYYNEVDRRLRTEFPQKFTTRKTGGGSQVASAGNSASRNTKQGRRSVKLTHSQVAIAKKLGVPLEQYAKYVKD
tara:strand:- start:288 stop:1178 length:891 start_codon:yes stop_codon:yes gene_type:complete